MCRYAAGEIKKKIEENTLTNERNLSVLIELQLHSD
jgi:hypothetical protein